MSQMNQKQATVSTILAVLAERGVNYELNGSTPIGDVLTEGDRANVREAMFAMFRDGSVGFKDEATAAKYEDDAELKKYISGLVNNWIRKEKTFNCGKAYVIKNPGSRAHVGDEQLKELMKLATQIGTGNEGYEDVMQAITARKNEIAAEKSKAVDIKIDVIPESLRHLVK